MGSEMCIRDRTQNASKIVPGKISSTNKCTFAGVSVYQVRYTNYSRLHAPVFELLLVRSLATFGGCEAKVMMRPHQRHRLSVARINRVRQGVVSFGMCEVALYVDSSGLVWLGLVPNNPPSTSPAPPTLVDPPRVRQMPPSRQTPNAAARSLRAAKQRGRDILTLSLIHI